jgi:hypothetical protein
MGVFETPQDSQEWAAKKHLLRYCDKHKNYFDPNIGCKDCEIEQTPIRPIPKVEFDPFRMAKSGYKYHAGSYWRRIYQGELDKVKGITLTDSGGIWVKVSLEEATTKLEIKELTRASDPPLQPGTNNDSKRVPIWAKLYPPDLNNRAQNSECNSNEPTKNVVITPHTPIPEVKKPVIKPSHPSFWEDLRRMIVGR